MMMTITHSIWAALTYSAMHEQKRYNSAICYSEMSKNNTLLQQIAESYLLSHALLSKLTWPWLPKTHTFTLINEFVVCR